MRRTARKSPVRQGPRNQQGNQDSKIAGDGDAADSTSPTDTAVGADTAAGCEIGSKCPAKCGGAVGNFDIDATYEGFATHEPSLVVFAAGAGGGFAAIGSGPFNIPNEQGDIGIIRFDDFGKKRWSVASGGRTAAGADDVVCDAIALDNGGVAIGAVLGASKPPFGDGAVGVIIVDTDGARAGGALVEKWPGPRWLNSGIETAQ